MNQLRQTKRYQTKPLHGEREKNRAFDFVMMMISLITGCIVIYGFAILIANWKLCFEIFQALFIDRIAFWGIALVVTVSAMILVTYMANRKLHD